MESKQRRTSKLKVCAVVVTYNRKEMLKECLISLLNQTISLDEIIVVDGPSTDGTELLMKENFSDITYVRLNEDVGGAGGFYEGMKLAYIKKYDWIWVMDDDAKSEPDTLEKLLLAVDEKPDVIARPILTNAPYFAPWFVGGIFSHNVISKIGLPLRELFIYYDDIEYIMRAKNAGIRTLDVKDARIYHESWLRSQRISRIILWKTISKPIKPLGRKYYYIQRNKVYIYLKHRKYKRLLYCLFVDSLFDLMSYLILGQPERVLCIIKGTVDGFFGKTGKSSWVHKL
jgi:GT2 family glycosyltransferase